MTEYKQTDFNRIQRFPKNCSCIDSIDHIKYKKYFTYSMNKMILCSGSSLAKLEPVTIKSSELLNKNKYRSNMTEDKYKSTRIIDGKPRQIIVNESGKIINRNPSKDELKGLEKEQYRKIKYTGEQLLGYLNQFEKENGRIPVAADFLNNSKYPSWNTLSERFGSWNDAILKAGLNVNYGGNKGNKYTDEELLNYLRQFVKEYDKTPKHSDFNNNPEYPHFDTYTRRFGSWTKAIEIGLDIKMKPRMYTDEELLNYLDEFEKENGRFPETSDFNNNPKYPHFATYHNRFGSWQNALEIGLGKKRKFKYTDEELLDYLKQFVKDNGRIPGRNDLINNHEYPGFAVYNKRFGSWSNTLKLVGLDVDTMVKNGIIETNDQKSRYAEMLVRNHFKKEPVDLAGENRRSPCDGICPNGLSYDVKSSKFDKELKRWTFGIGNEYKDKIEIIYLLAFNEDYTKLEYAWRITGWIAIEKDTLQVGLSPGYEFNIENMKEYNITDKLKDVIDKWQTIISEGEK